MRKFIVSGFADEFDGSLKAQIGGFRGLGIDYMEVRFVNGKHIADFSEGEVKELKAQLDVNNISVSAVGAYVGKSAINDGRNELLEKLERVCRYANILGAEYVRIFSFYPSVSKGFCEADVKEVYERLEKILAVAEKYNVTLCHENEYGTYGDSPERCLELMEYFGGRMKCVFDAESFLTDKNDLISSYDILKDYVAYFRIKECTGDARIEEILTKHAEKSKEPTFVSLEPRSVEFWKKDEGEETISGECSREKFSDAAHRLFGILERIEN